MRLEGSRARPETSGGGAAGAPLAIRLLGSFSVTVGEIPIPATVWRRRAAAKLVKLLALTPGHRLHRDQVVEHLWPDLDPRAAASNVYRALHAARHVLEPDLAPRAPSTYLHLDGERLVLGDPARPADMRVDVDAFEAAASTARCTRDPSRYSAALALYAGDLLPEDRYDDWVIGRREQLHLRYAELLRDAAQAYEAHGDLRAAIDALGRLVAAEPTDEEAHVALMRLFALAGRRDRARHQYTLLRATLRRELGAEPRPSSRRLYQALQAPGADVRKEEDRQGGVPAMPAPRSLRARAPGQSSRAPANLPCALTSFVGRHAEQAEVRALLQETRLVTLTGAGGCGKTRLALEVAASLGSLYADGIWLVELAPLADPGLVPAAVARCLGVAEQPGRSLTETLVEALRTRRLLLVLDNCEHLVDACASLADALLTGCPSVRILATSRERLRCAGETTWPVPPLLAPDPERLLPVDALARYDAIRLFVARARRGQPRFELTAQNAPAVARICWRLDGIPLAIELAAVRLQVLSAQEVAAGLDDALGLLAHGDRTAPPRHQTVRATLDWSYGLLGAAEQALLRALSVFAGGFTRSAAERMATDAPRQTRRGFLDLLTALVDKSLVIVDQHAEPVRYELLQTVRQYGLEHLRAAGEEVRVRECHRDWCLELAEDGAAAMDGPEQVAAIKRLEAEYANLQAALRWCQARGEIGPGLRLAGALWRFWFQHGHITDGRRWLELLLAESSSQDIAPAIRARALLGAGWCAFHQSDLGVATERFAASLALRRELGDRAGAALALLGLGNVAEERGDLDASAGCYQESLALERELGHARRIARALDHLAQLACLAGEGEQALRLADEALALRRGLGDDLGTAKALCNRGVALLHLGDLDLAESALAESLAARRRLGDALGVAVSSIYLANPAWRRGDMDRFVAYLTEALTIARAMGVMWAVPGPLSGLAFVLGRRGQAEQAAQLLGAADALGDATGIVVKPGEQALLVAVQEDRQRIREQLGEAAFQAALQQGRALPLEQAIEYALAAATCPETTPDAPKRPPGVAIPLTEREQEIAALIASGHTNRQIAADLSLSERTVDTHVSRILHKRGLSSRTQLAVHDRR